MANAAEERAVLEHFAIYRGPVPAAPIPTDLVDKVRRLAGDLGYAARVVEARDFIARAGVRERREPSAASGPTVVAPPFVDAHLIALAEHFSGRPAIRDVEHDPRLRGAGETALVLLGPDSPVDTVWQVLASLGERGVPFAVVPTDGSPAGRLPLLKALLFPSAKIVHVDRSGALPAEPPGMAGARPGILTVSGHGNSIDLGGGGDTVICARSDATHRDMAGLYPCFGDGRCFRQPLFGRPPESAEGLIDPARFRHALVLLLGCATFALGEAPFARRGTILWRMAESDALAAVATVGVFYHDANVETALFALLLEGHALGEAVRIFNAWHRDAYGHTSPAGERFGPLVAVGNPAFRFDRAIGRGELKIAKLEGGGTEELLLSAGSGVRIAGAQGGDVSTYVSVRSSAGADAAPAFDLLPFDRQACLADREVLRDSLPRFAMWRLLLADPGCPMASALGERGPQIVLDADVCGVERLLREYLATNAFASDALVPTLSTLAAHRLIMERWRHCQAMMLEAASLCVRRTGGFLFHLWERFYERDRGASPARACPSCGNDTEYLSYRGPADPADLHHVVHCPACGVLGQLPGGVAVRADGPLEACHGEKLMLDFDVAASRSAALRGEFMLVRESWFHTGEDVALSGAVAIDPGARESISLALPVAQGLAPGLYPLTLLGVVNGGLVQIRRHVSILEPAS